MKALIKSSLCVNSSNEELFSNSDDDFSHRINTKMHQPYTAAVGPTYLTVINYYTKRSLIILLCILPCVASQESQSSRGA